MNLNDQIIDEAQELARNKVLMPYADRHEIADAVSDIVGVRLDPDSHYAFLAEASHNRQLRLDEALEKAKEQANELLASLEEVA